MFKLSEAEAPRSIPYPEAPQSRTRISSRLLHIAALIPLLGLSIAAQSPGTPRTMSLPRQPGISDDNSFDQRIEARRIAMLNVIRQKSMITDAEKLLQLAKELNDDASGGHTLSPSDRIHKAGEIEKLAKNVKEKMTYVAGSGPTPSPNFTIQMP